MSDADAVSPAWLSVVTIGCHDFDAPRSCGL